MNFINAVVLSQTKRLFWVVQVCRLKGNCKKNTGNAVQSFFFVPIFLHQRKTILPFQINLSTEIGIHLLEKKRFQCVLKYDLFSHTTCSIFKIFEKLHNFLIPINRKLTCYGFKTCVQSSVDTQIECEVLDYFS